MAKKRLPKTAPPDEPKDVITQDGLRYKAKTAGSPFTAGDKSHGSATISCFWCGTHRPLSQRLMQPILGVKRPVCDPLCEKNPRHPDKLQQKAARAAAAAA